MTRHPESVARRGPAGFSLLELVLVVALLGVCVAIAVPRYAAATNRYRAQSAAGRISADLDLARRTARSTGTSCTVTFTVASSQYALVGIADFDGRDQDYRVSLSAAPYNARLLSVDFAGRTTVTFNGYGVPDAGGTIRLQVGQTVKTLTFSADSYRTTIQ